MANEITLTIQLRVVNGSYDPGQIGATHSITQSGIGASEGIVVAATTDTPITVGSVTTAGLLYLRNLDGTNFVSVGSTVYEFKMKAGEPFLGRVIPGKTINLKADTAACKVYQRFLMD